MSTENITQVETQSTEIALTETDETSSIYAGMNEVFAETRIIIDTMKDGEKIAIRDLVDKVTSKVDMSSGNVMGLVQLFCKRSKGLVSVEVGRGGGVFKGGKPKRVDNRPRCTTCNQVVRSETQKHKTEEDNTESVTEATNIS